MPEYIYRCPGCYDEQDIEEPMQPEYPHYCERCGAQMKRKPLAIRVNWGGLRPSSGDLAPNIQAMIDDAPRRREETTPHVVKSRSRRAHGYQ